MAGKVVLLVPTVVLELELVEMVVVELAQAVKLVPTVVLEQARLQEAMRILAGVD